MTFAIVDIETTGAFSHFNAITEVGIIVTDGNEILEQYETLIKPGEKIPRFITSLTGIDDQMVQDAPSFERIAQNIYNYTKDHIFVAHNVSFDYGFLRKAFKELDIHFYRKKICTVRMAKEILPGYQSYSLGKIAHQLGIIHENRHRAMGDALATFELLKMMLAKERGYPYVEKAIKKQSVESGLPSNLPKAIFDAIPEETGVYNFHDKLGKIIYTGKAKNLKSRIISHFNSKAKKQQIIRRELHNITYDLTGCDLCAELLESEMIKVNLPKLNAAQRINNKNWSVILYENQNGYKCFGLGKASSKTESICWFSNYYQARKFLEEIVAQYNLCPKLCGLQKSANACYNYLDGICEGACICEEKVKKYNKKVKQATKEIKNEAITFVITDKGRTSREKSIVVVEKGKYLGFGFMPKQTKINSIKKAKSKIELRQDNTDVQRILNMYLSKGNLKIDVY